MSTPSFHEIFSYTWEVSMLLFICSVIWFCGKQSERFAKANPVLGIVAYFGLVAYFIAMLHVGTAIAVFLLAAL